MFFHIGVAAQTIDSLGVDSLRTIIADEVVVISNSQQRAQRLSPLAIEIVGAEQLAVNFSGDLIRTLEYIPGVQSMSVGSGFSKPMIRGMAFNRVSVYEYDVKQEGQQWGTDHGLELDAFNVDRVNIVKGSSSLNYGGDAMGGVIEILRPVIPTEDGFFGEFDLLGRSVNGLMGGSLMLGVKSGSWFARVRHSEQHFADFAVPTDTVVYLTQKIPLADGYVNNTAGSERSSSLYLRYGSGRFSTALSASNVYQKAGFFAGAHGIPDPDEVIDDGDLRDVDLPYSSVNHLKVALQTKYLWDDITATWNLAYQNNHREEWSYFHTHYGTQEAPEVDPDLEIALFLNNYSSGMKLDIAHSSTLSSVVSWDIAYQSNDIAGYSFLLPAYERLTTGVAWVSTYRATGNLLLSGGVRYDYGHIATEEYADDYLVTYLQGAGYSDEVVEENRVRSYAIDRDFGDYSFSLGGVWDMDSYSSLRFNAGRSFRLPMANELASNGLHHSSFRHEQGDPTLDSERGWQFDVEYGFESGWLSLSFSPYVSWYASYIYLQPTGEWSVLPDAGQIYRYSQCEAFFTGAELSAEVRLPLGFSYNLGAEYVYSVNLDRNVPLSFTPPTTVRNSLGWSKKLCQLTAEWKFIADQNRVAQNEDPTPGANLFNFSASFDLSALSEGASLTLSVDNIFNTKYLNHLSYYRQVEIPEPGRNFQLSLKIPFKL